MSAGALLQSGAEETRYRAVLAVDADRHGGLAELMAALDDPSWRVQAAAAEQIAAMRDPRPAVAALVAALAADAPAARRAAAATALARIGPPAVESVGVALASSAPETRTTAAEILGQIGDRTAVPLLTSRLSDRDGNARVAAAEALGKLGGEHAIAALHLVLRVRGDAPLQLAALDALTRLRAPPDAATLREVVSERPLRRAALRLAGCSDEPGALVLLGEALRDAPRGPREAALGSLGDLRLRRGRGALDAVATIIQDAVRRDAALAAALDAALASGRDDACLGALAVLEHAGTPAQALAIVRAAEHEVARPLVCDVLEAIGPAVADGIVAVLPQLGPAPRAAALEALARLGDRRVVAEICADVASSDEATRASAANAFATLGAVAAIPPIADLLDYRDPGISGAAASALERLAQRDEEARAAVLEACRPSARLTPARCRLLGRIGEVQDTALLRRAVREGDSDALRAAALSAIAALAARGVAAGGRAPEIVAALGDASPAVRVAAARALALASTSEVPWPDALAALAAALRDAEPVVRAAAALALGKARARQHAPALAALAVDPSTAPEVAAAAVRALSEMGAARLEVLESAMRHPDSEVVKEAVAAAIAIPGPAGASLLLTTAAHPRWDVRRAAANAMRQRGDRTVLEAARRLAAAEDDSLVAEALADAIRALEAAP